jgi:hypothetical protein
MPTILFPSQPFERVVDPDFASEMEDARAQGFSVGLVDHTRVTRGDMEGVFRIPDTEDRRVLYRGWMLTPDQYRSMCDALVGWEVLTSPEAYKHCHYLPNSYRIIEGRTPYSLWFPKPVANPFDLGALFNQISAVLGDRPIVLKDYVKSESAYWKEACFIPSATDWASFEAVVSRFLAMRDEYLNEGLVFREYVDLTGVEVRTFWAKGQLIFASGDAPVADFQDLASKVQSPFFSMDLGLLKSGDWTIVELGDGQVSSFKAEGVGPSFYARLKEVLK